jgi:hypothetical protein
MYLLRLIEILEKCHPGRPCKYGFAMPHSYRGDYFCLAFRPKRNQLVGEMLTAAKSALGAIYTGWKGGEYEMNQYTEVFLADQGKCGIELNEVVLAVMLEITDEVMESIYDPCQENEE